MEKQNLIELLLLSILIALLYQTPQYFKDFSKQNKNVSKLFFLSFIIFLNLKVSLNASILATGIFYLIVYNRKMIEDFDSYPDVETDEGFENFNPNSIGSSPTVPSDADPKGKYTVGRISKRNMVDLDRKFKKDALKKKRAAVFQQAKK
jgi:hypothetical protein